jgi:hypothetical protein
VIFVLAWLIITNAKYPEGWQLLAWGLQQATYLAIVGLGAYYAIRNTQYVMFLPLALPLIHPAQTLEQLFAYLWLFALFSAGYLGWKLETGNWKLGRAALWVFIPYALISPFVPTNTNIVAMELWALFFVALPSLRNTYYVITYCVMALAIIAIALTGSEGGLLALGAGLLWYWFRWRGLLVIPLALVALLWFKWDDMGSLGVRLELYKHAWDGFTLTPIMGQGWGSFYYEAAGLTFYQPHNLPLDVLYSWGLIGLVTIAFFTIHYSPFTIHNAPFFVAFLTHSLVDNPHWTALPGLLAAFLLGRVFQETKQRKITQCQHYPINSF